jgi:hypothetical protein
VVRQKVGMRGRTQVNQCVPNHPIYDNMDLFILLIKLERFPVLHGLTGHAHMAHGNGTLEPKKKSLH